MSHDQGATNRRSKKHPTATDVARLAGCSQAAVSLWLNGRHEKRLSEQLQVKIAKAVAELGYVPNRIGQRLSLGNSRSLSFIFPGHSYHFFGTLLEGATSALGREWEVSFFDSRVSRDISGAARLVSRAFGADTAGLLLASPSQDELAAIAHLRTAAVVIDAPTSPETTSLVSFDTTEAIYQAARDLAAAGHRRVGYVFLQAEGLTLIERRKNMASALKDHGISIVDPDLRPVGVDVESTAKAFTEKWTAWKRHGVTAVVCADERHAYGILLACRTEGIHVPDDLSLVAFNDSPSAALLAPALASIRLPAVEMGAAAGRALITHITTHLPVRTSVPAHWYLRDSLATAPF